MLSLVGINPQAWLMEHHRENARLIEVAAIAQVQPAPVPLPAPAPLPILEVACCR